MSRRPGRTGWSPRRQPHQRRPPGRGRSVRRGLNRGRDGPPGRWPRGDTQSGPVIDVCVGAMPTRRSRAGGTRSAGFGSGWSRNTFLGISGRQHEDDVPGRLFEGLEQRAGRREVIWCTSSMMYTFHRPGLPSATRPRRSRISSMPRLVAESSSCTSSEDPWRIATQDGQVPSGSPSTVCSQLRAMAKMRAVDVLPVPRGPLKR